MNETMINRVELCFLSTGDNVALARVTAAAFAAPLEMTINELEELKVAISEAVSNAMIHGYENKNDCMVEMTLTRYETRLEICVRDNGVGIADIEKAMEPGFSQSPERMGLGFSFMHSFMDKLAVSSALGRGTTVTMTKYLNSGREV